MIFVELQLLVIIVSMGRGECKGFSHVYYVIVFPQSLLWGPKVI